jgi:transcriptional regulator with XRE-family HTH domain
VRHRREELGLTRAEVADRAGITEEVVSYVEEEPASVRGEIVLRLAYALDVPDFSLLGSDADVPPEFGGRRPRLDVLAEQECWRLLDEHGVGRVGFLTESDDSPHVHPLNYTIRSHSLVLRARQGSLLDTMIGRFPQGFPASFEVDRVDDAQCEGWSVLLRGRLACADAEGEPAAAEPWAGGIAVRKACLTPQMVTGRRIFVD